METTLRDYLHDVHNASFFPSCFLQEHNTYDFFSHRLHYSYTQLSFLIFEKELSNSFMISDCLGDSGLERIKFAIGMLFCPSNA